MPHYGPFYTVGESAGRIKKTALWFFRYQLPGGWRRESHPHLEVKLLILYVNIPPFIPPNDTLNRIILLRITELLLRP